MILAGVCPHAARVGSEVALIRPLVILDRHHVGHMRSVAERLQAEFLAFQPLFDDDASATLREFSLL